MFCKYLPHTSPRPGSARCSTSKKLKKVKVCVPVVQCLVVSKHGLDVTPYEIWEKPEEKLRFCV